MSQNSPMMIQYKQIKEQYKDSVLFFRLGDFYEMFNEDAEEISRLLNLTLTQRGGYPMCGIPYHASRIYIARLLRLGKKIAVCEQISVPTPGKGLAERKVVEVITPGTTVESEYLEQGANNFLAALSLVEYSKQTFVGFAYVDVSTGEFCATNWCLDQMNEQLLRELGRVSPREIILSQSTADLKDVQSILSEYPELVINIYPDWHFKIEASEKNLKEHFGTANLKAFGLLSDSPEIPVAGFLLEYLSNTVVSSGSSKTLLQHISGLRLYSETEFVILDDSSRKNLEIVANLRDGTTQYTLLEVLNQTCTPIGSRYLRKCLLNPLTDSQLIQERQQQVSILIKSEKKLDLIRSIMSKILDIERFVSRIAMDRAHARDLHALRTSLNSFIHVKKEAEESGYIFSQKIIGENIQVVTQIINLIQNSIKEDPSVVLNEGNLIKDGWSAELDHLHQIKNNFTEVLDEYLEEEKAKTGIQSLKIRFNRMIGYYIEVTKGNLSAVPSHFIRRRSLVNGDRFSTDRLEKLERELTGADEQIIEKERLLFIDVRNTLKQWISVLLDISTEIAMLDVIQSFAFCAYQNDWECPVVDDSSTLIIEEGRHPVVEKHLPLGEFVPNSLNLGVDGKTFSLITGPNMAGKSTYLRQNALIVLMAQIGSYVPVLRAHIGVVDRIFCRVGASDNLARGESTFLVEMNETAHILRSATSSSLVIMDEVGRGTSTEDGLSIAWAVSEYLLNAIGAKTLFATHYHELSRMLHPALSCLCLDVLEKDGHIVFLKRVKEGASDNSYGIYVAKLAGIPHSVVIRAEEILQHMQKVDFTEEKIVTIQSIIGSDIKDKNIEKNQSNAVLHISKSNIKDEKISKIDKNNQLSSINRSTITGLFSQEELVIGEILSINPDSTTPLEALQKIMRWKKELSGM